MIRCAVNRGSTAAGRLPAARRAISTNASSQDASSPQPTDHEDGGPSRALPLSPLMDPKFLEARQRHHLTKNRPKKADFTPFQRELRKNPYALALATPVRQCKVTKQLLPKFFLQGFNLLAHPETGVPWWMPKDLVRKPARSADDRMGTIDEAQASDEAITGKEIRQTEGLSSNGAKREDSAAETAPESQTTQGVVAQKRGEKEIRLRGFTSYTLLRKEVLTEMRKNESLQRLFVDMQLLRNPGGRELFMTARFRQDMDDFLLELMRRRTVEDLTQALQSKRTYLFGCKDWDAATAEKQVGAYLWVNGDTIPDDFATVDVGSGRQEKVPVYNLEKLLGKSHLDGLKAIVPTEMWDNEVLALRHGKGTIELQMRLWKLQGYIADYSDQEVD